MSKLVYGKKGQVHFDNEDEKRIHVVLQSCFRVKHWLV